MRKSILVHFSLAVSAFAIPTLAQDAADRTLLATFCDAPNIKGDTCTHAKGYPASGNKRNCEVKLLKDRFTGRFIASSNPLLVVNYDSGCEARANDDGGSAVFEQVKGNYSFVGFQPGMRAMTASPCRAARSRTRWSASPGIWARAISKAAWRRCCSRATMAGALASSTISCCGRRIQPARPAPMS